MLNSVDQVQSSVHDPSRFLVSDLSARLHRPHSQISPDVWRHCYQQPRHAHHRYCPECLFHLLSSPLVDGLSQFCEPAAPFWLGCGLGACRESIWDSMRFCAPRTKEEADGQKPRAANQYLCRREAGARVPWKEPNDCLPQAGLRPQDESVCESGVLRGDHCKSGTSVQRLSRKLTCSG